MGLGGWVVVLTCFGVVVWVCFCFDFGFGFGFDDSDFDLDLDDFDLNDFDVGIRSLCEFQVKHCEIEMENRDGKSQCLNAFSVEN